MADEIKFRGDPALLIAGTIMRHRDGGTSTLASRKSDDSGWWCAEGGGLGDAIFEREEWTIVSVPDAPVLYAPTGKWERR